MNREQGRWLITTITALGLLVLLSSLIILSSPVYAGSNNQPRLAPQQQGISPADIIARAKSWVDAQVSYNRRGWYQGYREDCSGYVSMAWQLSHSLTTYTLSSVSHQISKDDLQPGDILLNQWGGRTTYDSPFAHVVIFDSWADSSHTRYNAYEESDYYGEAHYTTNMPYPYWPGYDTSDYVPMRFDPTKVGSLSLSPTPSIKPGGQWVSPPSPTNGDTVTDVIHFAVHAYPTNPGDPPIDHVNFTVSSQGSWKVACTVSPPATGDVFSCDANLKDLGVPYGQIQVSFDVYDQAGNVNYAPNGVHTLTYAPSPGVTPVPPTPIPSTPIPPTPVPPTPVPPTPIPPTPIPPTPIPPTPVPPTPVPPTPVPVTLPSGTWNDPYGGASYGTGEPVTIVLTVNGSNVSGTMTGDISGGTTPITGQTGPLSSFSQQDQGFLDYVVQNYGSGTGVFLVYQNTQDFIGAFAGSTYYMVLQSNGTLQGFWYFPNQQIDTGALTFNRIS